MPTYRYRCNNCGYDFTKIQSISENSLTKCPRCGKDMLHKVYSAVPIEFKGSGFYRTDRDKSGK